MKKGTTGQARTHIEASPDAVYDVVSDVTRMGEWSPETIKCEWVDGATHAVAGARFKGSNKRGFARWSTKPTVLAAERGREFSFDVDGAVKWTYRFTPAGSGTDVEESFEMLKDLPAYIAFAERYVMRIKDRRADLEAAMGQTLERIKRAVEATPPS